MFGQTLHSRNVEQLLTLVVLLGIPGIRHTCAVMESQMWSDTYRLHSLPEQQDGIVSVSYRRDMQTMCFHIIAQCCSRNHEMHSCTALVTRL